jgi:C-terminal processing protease CtpA/Prc
MVEQSYTVNVPVTMTRTVIRNGVPVEEKYTVNKAETNTRSVPITKYVPRMEIRTVAEEVPTLSVRRNGELQVISGDFGKRTIGISFQITQDGLEIISVKEGSPATNCRDADGNVLALKPGDVILSLNGETPTDTERVLTLIGDSRSDIRIEVRDKEGTTARRLIVTPR